MATSGSAVSNFTDSRFKLEARWYATNQNIPENYTTVKVEVWFWAGVNINVSGKTLNINIDGTPYSMTSNRLQGNGKWIKMGEATKDITHNPDGTKSFSYSASMTVGSVSGLGNVGSASVSSSGDLNAIPRASTMSNDVSWTAPNSFTVNINRYSSAFTHKVEITMYNKKLSQWVWIGNMENQTNSATFNFTEGQNAVIFECMNGTDSALTAVNIYTYSGGTQIGTTQQKQGYVYRPSTKAVTVSNFNIGYTAYGTVSNFDNRFTYEVKFVFGSWSKTFAVSSQYPTFTWTYADEQAMFSQIPNSKQGLGTVETKTLYHGVQVGTTQGKNFTAYVVDSNPTFSNNGVTYADTNTTTKGITGNDQYIIQSKSYLMVQIPSSYGATAVNGASMKEYVITVAGQSVTKTYSTSTISHTFYDINISTNTTLTVSAIDSRGNSTSIYKTVLILPYSQPTINAKAERRNGFEETTLITVSGNISLLNVNGVNKNSIQGIGYRFRESTGQFPPTFTPFTRQTNGSSYTVTPVEEEFDSTKSYVVEFEVKDKLGTYHVSRTVETGKPIMFIDSDKKSVSVGKYPTYSNSLEVAGNITADIDIVAGNGMGANKFYIAPASTTPAIIEQTGRVTKLTNGTRYLEFDLTSATITELETGASNVRFKGNGSYINFYMPSGNYMEVTTDKTYIDFESTARFYKPVVFANSDITTSTTETGFCGVGGIGLNSTTARACAGVGVNFRIKKTYTPYSVDLVATSNTTNALYTNITQDGFWLYVEGAGTSTYYYWRGYYTC